MQSNREYGPSSQEQTPMYYQCLNARDQMEYNNLRNEIAKTIATSGRSHFCKSFGAIVNVIEKYVVRHNTDDNKRSLVCGIVWMNNKEILALNTRQLTTLIGKCKSSVNAGFQSIGYSTVPMEAEPAAELAGTFPFLRESFGLMRQWTLRRLQSSKQENQHKKVEIITADKITPAAEIQQPPSVLIDEENDFSDTAKEPAFVDIIDENDWFTEDGLYYTTFC